MKYTHVENDQQKESQQQSTDVTLHKCFTPAIHIVHNEYIHNGWSQLIYLVSHWKDGGKRKYLNNTIIYQIVVRNCRGSSIDYHLQTHDWTVCIHT